ncbi:MAG: hypothetical protein NVS3B28_17900 [Candidatus Velthaea sp.]
MLRLSFFIALALGVIAPGAFAAANPGAKAPLAVGLQGKPVVAVVRADWCPACHEVEPVLERVRQHYGAKISFVAFDVTNAKTARGAAELAKRDGLFGFYNASKTATATVAVIDPKTGKIVAQFYDQTDLAAYVQAVDKALALAK